MLGNIVRKEILDHINSMKFVVTFVVVIVLVISGLAIGTKDYREKVSELQYQNQKNLEMMASQSNWLTAGYVGITHSKIPHVLSIIDNGIDNSLGRLASISLGPDATFDSSRNLMAPILAVFGAVDLSFVVKIILSLFVILLTFDSISGEKERGTLKLTLSNRVSRSTFIIGKMLGGFAVIMFAFILPLILGMAFLMTFYPQVIALFTQDVWIRFLMIILAYILYLAVFFSLGLFVSALSKKSATSFIILLMIWVLFVAIIPRVSLMASERMQPYESYSVLQTKAAKEISAAQKERMKEYQDQAKMIKAFQDGKFGEYFADMFDALTEEQQKITSKYNEEFIRQQNSQITLAESISRTVSPTSALSFALENLAGSGYERQKEYLNQVRAFQENYRKDVINKIRDAELKTQKEIQDFFAQESLDVSQQMVSFKFQDEELETVINRSLPDLAVLVILSLLFFIAAFVAFIRYDVR